MAIEDIVQTGPHLTLEVIKAVIAKEMVKVQREWQTFKQEIVEAIRKVEVKVEQLLLVLEAKMDKM